MLFASLCLPSDHCLSGSSSPVLYLFCDCCVFFFFKQKTAYEMRISDWSSEVCSSDLPGDIVGNIERPRRIDRIDLTGIEAHNLVLEIGVEQGDAEAELAFAVVAQADFLSRADFGLEIRIAAQRATHQRAAAGGHAIVSDALPQGRRLEAARDAASQGPARHEGIVHISARREMRSELIVMVDTRAAGDDESVERPDLVLDEQRPGFASQLVRVDIAGDIVLRADTRCLGVDILSTDRRGVPVGRGNGHHSINGPVDQIRSIERYAIVLVLKLFLLPVGGQPGLRATEIAVGGQRLIIAAMAFEK